MEVYDGPQLKPPTISLLTSAEIIPIEGNRWESGFDLVNEGDEIADVQVIADCIVPNDLARSVEGTGVNESYVPFLIFATDKCSTFPAKRDFFGRAERKLLAAEASILERQLWDAFYQTGQPHLADGAGASNVTATTTIATTTSSAAEAFAILEQEMGEASATRGMIHLRPLILHKLLDANVVRRVGNVYLSPMDNIVVPGRGYPGTGPTGQAIGATEWMFGHPGMVQIRRSETVRLNESELENNIDRYVNDRQAIVQRVVHVALDTSLGTFAVDFGTIV